MLRVVFFGVHGCEPGRVSEKDKTPNHDSVVIVQDDRMGFHICIVGY